MFEKVKTLKFSSKAFQVPSSFEIFSKPKYHTCLIYGRNGAGKSTVAKAFKKLSGDTVDGIISAELWDHGNSLITLSEEEQKSIYVFDEAYINKKIRIRSDGLDTIIMLGEQAEIDDQIQELSSELDKAKAAKDAAEKEHSRFTDAQSTDNPNYYFDRATETLKHNWVVRRKAITQRNSTPVTNRIVEQLATAVPIISEEESYKEFYEKQELLNGLRNNECQAITARIPAIPLVDEKGILALLAKKIEKPELTERENKMVELIAGGRPDYLKEIRTVFSDPNIEECPFCYQPVTRNYKEHLLESITSAFNKEAEEHTKMLENALMQKIEIDFSPFYAADKSLCEECRSLLIKLNDRIEFCNINLTAKKNDIYTTICLSDIGLDDAYNLLVITIKSLERKVVEYNQSVSSVTTLQSRLNKLNDILAFYEISPIYNDYIQKQSKSEQAVKNADNAKAEVKHIEQQIQKLSQQKKQISIAVDIINSYLNYIFCESKRLEIQPKEDRYVILSRGREVTPDAISVGERNIIALCYFFVAMFDGKEKKKQYTNETLVVIDDPVSSFDIDNHIGIISFLNLQFNKLLNGNTNTRVILMSHDLQTFDDISKVFYTIIGSKRDRINNLMLENNELKSKDNIQNEYKSLIDIVYKYATGSPNGNELTIGNTIRRVAEAFTTFEYKGGIEKLLDSDVLSVIDDSTLHDYFEGRMMKLFLHGTSHMEERVKTLTNPGFTIQFSERDKQRTARDIICLLYLLNKPHISAYLNDNEDFQTTIGQWCEDIRNEMGNVTEKSE